MSATDSVLPSSRQPVPVSPEVQAELDKRPPTVAEIERRLDETTRRLAANIDELSSRLSPRRIVDDRVSRLKARVTTPGGQLRAEVIGAAAGAAVAMGVLVWWVRRRR